MCIISFYGWFHDCNMYLRKMESTWIHSHDTKELLRKNGGRIVRIFVPSDLRGVGCKPLKFIDRVDVILLVRHPIAKHSETHFWRSKRGDSPVPSLGPPLLCFFIFQLQTLQFYLVPSPKILEWYITSIYTKFNSKFQKNMNWISR